MVVMHNVSLTAPPQRTKEDEEYAGKSPNIDRGLSYGVKVEAYGRNRMNRGSNMYELNRQGLLYRQGEQVGLGQREEPFSASKALYLHRN